MRRLAAILIVSAAASLTSLQQAVAQVCNPGGSPAENVRDRACNRPGLWVQEGIYRYYNGPEVTEPEPLEPEYRLTLLEELLRNLFAQLNVRPRGAQGGIIGILLLQPLVPQAQQLVPEFRRVVTCPVFRGPEVVFVHQFHRDQVPGFFRDLELESARDVDHLWLDLESRYHEEACHSRRRGFGKLLRNLTNPFQYPIAAMRILGKRPVHRKRPEERPLMASMLYIFGRPTGEA